MRREEGDGLPARGLRGFHERVSLYIVAATAILMLLGIAASVVLTFWWSASISPVSDGAEVLKWKSKVIDEGFVEGVEE